MRTARCARCILSCLAGFFVALLASSARADPQASSAKYHEVMFDSSTSDASAFDAFEPPGANPNKQTALHILVPNTSLQAQLKALKLQKGDILAIETFPSNDGHDTLKSVHIETNDVSLTHTIVIFIIFAGLYVVGCAVLTLGNPRKLMIGEDGHYSNSKFQMFLWFGMLITAYLASVFLKAVHSYYALLGNVTIPQNLLLLSGMSALTFAAAKGITTAKVQAAVDAGVVNPKPLAAKARFFYDLTHNDKNQLDFGDFQMIIVTLVAVGMHVVMILHFMGSMELRAATSLPDVDTTILASFGLGQGAYLTKKAVGNVGET